MWNHLRRRRFWCRPLAPHYRDVLESHMLAPILYISKWNSNFLVDTRYVECHRASRYIIQWVNRSAVCVVYIQPHTTHSWVCSVSEEVCETGLIHGLSVQMPCLFGSCFLSQASYDLLTWDVIWANEVHAMVEVMCLDVMAQKCYLTHIVKLIIWYLTGVEKHCY